MESVLWYRLEEGQGEPLPLPWAELNMATTLKRGQMLVIGGLAGGGKSTMACNLVSGLSLPALYFAQDDPNQIYQVLSALFLEEDTKDLHKDVAQQQRLQAHQSFKSVFINRFSVSLEDMGYYIDAYRELVGHYPSLVVIDNLLNMSAGNHSYTDMGFYSSLLPKLKLFAVDYGVLLVILHHTKRNDTVDKDGQLRPPTIQSLMYSGEKEADHVWFVRLGNEPAFSQEHEYEVYILKQRMGRADPQGGLAVKLAWDPSTKKLKNRTQTVDYSNRYWDD